MRYCVVITSIANIAFWGLIERSTSTVHLTYDLSYLQKRTPLNRVLSRAASYDILLHIMGGNSKYIVVMMMMMVQERTE